MKRVVIAIIQCMFLGLGLFPILAVAQGTAGASAPVADAQTIATTVCIACHAADGNSPTSANPKLAGQHADYLYKQMKDFNAAPGKEAARKNPTMNVMLMAYSDKQLHALADYFASKKLVSEQAANLATIEVGRTIYRAGDASRGVPACSGCHGPAGAGIPAQYPRIGGQYSAYIESQLRAFQLGTRANDPNEMMRLVAIKMTDAQIKAVSDYVAGLR